MILIPPIAWIGGFTASMLFMILGWPLANALSLVRVLFDSFQMKLILAAAIGVASAPIAEQHAPFMDGVLISLKEQTQKAPEVMKYLSDLMGCPIFVLSHHPGGHNEIIRWQLF